VDDSAENVRKLLRGRPNLFGVHYANPDTYLEDRWTFRDYVQKAEESFAQAEQDQSRGYKEKARKHYRHSFEYYFNAVVKILTLEGIDRPQAYAELEKINTALTHFVAKQVEGKWQLINLVREAKEGRSPFFHDVPNDNRPPATVNPWAVTGRDLEMTLQDMYSSHYLRGPEELILKLRRRVLRVYELADQLGDVFGLPDEIKSVLRVASLIHDLGKGYSDNSLELHFQPIDRRWLPESSQKTLDAFLEDGFKILDGDHERRHKSRRAIEVPAESKLLVRYVNDKLSGEERRGFEGSPNLFFAALLFKLAYEYSERVSIRPGPDESRGAAGRIRNREDVKKWLDSKLTDGTIDQETHSKMLPVFRSAFDSQERSTSSIGQGLPEPRFHKEIMELEPFRPLSMIALTSLLITTGPSSADIIQNQQRGVEKLLNQLVKEALVKAVGPEEAERMMQVEPKTIDTAVSSLRDVTPAGRERIRQIFSQKQKILEHYGISYFTERAKAFLNQDLDRSLQLVEEFERDLKLLGELIDERFQRTRQHYQQLRDQFRAAQEGFRRYLVVEDDPGFQWYWRIKILRRHPPHARKSIEILLAKSPEEAMRLIGSQGPSYPGPEMVISDLQMPVTDPKTGQSRLDNDAGWRLSRWIRKTYPRAFVLVESMTPFPTAADVDGALHKYNSFYGEYILDMIEQLAISHQRARASGRLGPRMPFEGPGPPPTAGRSLGRPSAERTAFGSREITAVFQRNLMEGREPAFLLLPSSLLGGVESVSLETVLRNPANKVIILWDGDEKGRPLISPGERFDHLMKTGAASCMGRKNFSPNIANSQLDGPSSLGGRAEAASRALLSRGIGPERISFLKPASMRERVNGALSLREGPHLPLYLMLYLIQTQGRAVNDLLGILRRDAETGDYSVVLSKELERIFREALAERLRAQAA
jgi:CheY-like chemotaxis protein